MNLFSWIGRTLRGKAVSAEAPAKPVKSLDPIFNKRLPTGFRYLRAREILKLERFQSVEEFVTLGNGVFHPEGEPPALVLFVSHRWESDAHPDPASNQLKALQYVLRYIPEVASLRIAPAAERLQRLRSIRTHGVIHAALLLGARDESDRAENVWQDWAHAVNGKDATQLLDHVGIWYDYSCMPQSAGNPKKWPRNTMFENLTKLPDLVRTSVLLMLRKAGDDYSERGWCAAEVAAARHDSQLIVLRMDLVGTPIEDAELSLVDRDDTKGGYNFFESAHMFRSVLDKWESLKTDAPSLWNLYTGFPDIKIREESRDVPLLTTGRNPAAFPQQRALLIRFMEVFQVLSAADARDGYLSSPLDLAETVRNSVKAVGLKCTEEWDVVYVGLAILQSRHHPGLVPTIAELYRIAIEKWVKGESLNLVRYRENREAMSWEAWYLFEGEPADVRAKPRWAS